MKEKGSIIPSKNILSEYVPEIVVGILAGREVELNSRGIDIFSRKKRQINRDTLEKVSELASDIKSEIPDFDKLTPVEQQVVSFANSHKSLSPTAPTILLGVSQASLDHSHVELLKASVTPHIPGTELILPMEKKNY